jgi:hypothetical protein
MSIIGLWISWYLKDVSKNYFSAYKNFLKFGLNFFSTPLLLKSLFSPWKRIGTEFPKNFDIALILEAIFFNLFSRCFGAFFRTILIMVGLIFEVIIFVLGIVFYLLWLLSPILIILGILYSIQILI